MANDECLMTKEWRNPNDEKTTMMSGWSPFKHSGFFRHSDFELRHYKEVDL